MPADRMLNTVLQLYQDVHDDHKTDQIVGSTTRLLTTLSNPLNLGVLTSQLLIAPALWHRKDGLRTSVRIISVYNTAAIRIRQYEAEAWKSKGPRQGGGLSSEAWTRAVVKGADDRSSRWQHLLVLVGVLLGMEGGVSPTLSRSLRNTLEQAVVTAANLALERPMQDGPLGAASIVLALNYAFPLLSDTHKSLINCDALLPMCIWAMTGEEGFHDGQIVGAIGLDVRQIGQQFSWPPSSPSFRLLQSIEGSPLIGSLGPLSKLTSFAIHHSTDPKLVLQAQAGLLEFSRKILHQWEANKLSGLDQAEEMAHLTPETVQATWSPLWTFLKKIMFATVAVLEAVVARSLLDPHLRSDAVAPGLATKSLHILRNLYFISSRNGNNAFQVYTFTYLTSLDTIVRYPDTCIAFLRDTLPSSSGIIPTHPLHRALDLFYLNVSEHLPLNIPSEACDTLIVQPATVYLTYTGPLTSTMIELFESAHSAVLSVLSCPHNNILTVRLVPFYIDTLFASFPSHISTRQFRLAFKTVMQIVSPPFPISATHPELSETLLEMVYFRAVGASTAPLPPTPDFYAQGGTAPIAQEPFSEQSSLVLTLVDSLPFLPLPLVEDWLTLTARTLNEIVDPVLRQPVKDRFWEVLVSGEMDVERAAIGVAWWGTKGGRELVMRGSIQEAFVMSGAILDEGNTSRL